MVISGGDLAVLRFGVGGMVGEGGCHVRDDGDIMSRDGVSEERGWGCGGWEGELYKRCWR